VVEAGGGFTVTVYCQAPNNFTALNQFVCSTSPPAPEIVRGHANVTGIVEIISPIAFTIVAISAILTHYDRVIKGRTRADLKEKRQVARTLEKNRHDAEMARIEVDRQKELNKTVAGYTPKIIKEK
jgi:hypothetical protein